MEKTYNPEQIEAKYRSLWEDKNLSLYCGVTNDLDKRLRQHNGDIVGGAKYTRANRPCVLASSVVNHDYKAGQYQWCNYLWGCYRKSRDRKLTGTLSGSMFYACANGICAISTLVGPFHRK
jgi:hypothetical protein